MTTVFPSSHRTDLVRLLDGSPDQRLQAVRLLLERYIEPLVVYARGSSLREISDPVDLVQGFLADRLLRDDYLARWTVSGLPLRKWLVNGLHLYAKEQRRAALRHQVWVDSVDIAAERLPASEAAWARALLVLACEHVEEELRSSGHPAAWELFRRHFIDGVSYARLVNEFGMTPAGMAESSRRVSSLLRETIRVLLVREGVEPSHVDRELRCMLRALEENR